MYTLILMVYILFQVYLYKDEVEQAELWGQDGGTDVEAWTTPCVTLPTDLQPDSAYEIKFKATRGTSHANIKAIDNIKLSQGHNCPRKFRYERATVKKE